MAQVVGPEAFREVVPPLTAKEAEEEALRCYYCYDAPCIQGCPTGIDIPVFIKHIATGDLKASARTILDANILGATCARICPTEALCEGHCVRTADSRAVSIGRLQRVAMDAAMEKGLPALPPLAETPAPRVGRVAIVGAGPAGLSAAATLRRLGHEVDVYEAYPRGGGLDTYGIVSYREPMAISLWEADMVEQMGVRFHYETRVGVDISWASVRATRDAVIVAVGLGRVPLLNIPGEDLRGVWDALELVEATKTGPIEAIDIGRRVVVVGAGNTAVDAATCAKRLGAEDVTIVYRRGEEAMSAYGYEYTFAKQEGVAYRWWTRPVEVMGDGRVSGLRVVRTAPSAGAASTDRKAPLVTVPGSETVLPADTVIRAIGQEKPEQLWQDLSVPTDHGRVVLKDPATFATSVPGVYVVGDALGRPGEATVVQCVEDGKRVAQAIHRELGVPQEERRCSRG